MKILRIIGICILFFSICLAEGKDVDLLPWPAELTRGVGEFTIDAKTTIVAPVELTNEAQLLAEPLRAATGFRVPIVTSAPANSLTGTILFNLNPRVNIVSPEGYHLSVKPGLVTIEARQAAGHFYATRTLLQLLPPYAATGQKPPVGMSMTWAAPSVEITDQPRFVFRSLLIDDARKFQGVAALKRYLDEMAALKMNVFHWHFTDNDGWRLEIKRYPKLTALGSTRAGPRVGDLIAPVDSAAPARYYYTQEEAREVVAYAAKRHIRVIPEVEMPGHAKAALRAYPEWSANGSFDITKPDVITALKNILDEVIAIFPDTYLHTGGDEVRFGEWEKAPSIQAAMAAKGLKSSAPLQQEFTTFMAKYLRSKGRRMIYWADDLAQIPDEPSAILQFWRGKPEVLSQAAQRGHDLINCSSSFTYLDYNYASLPLDKAYNFDPIPAGVDKKNQHQVLGLGTQAWGEYTPTQFRFEIQVFPRLAAMAEAAWTPLNKKDYTGFVTRLQTQQTRWALAGILYTPDCEIPLAKLQDEVRQGAKLGSWTADQVKVPKSRYSADPDSYHEFDVTDYISGAGRYRVAAIPTAGGDALCVRVAEILENGKPVTCDWAGISGTVVKIGAKTPEYIIELGLSSVKPGAKYILRLNYFGLQGTDSAGDFYIKKIGSPLPVRKR